MIWSLFSSGYPVSSLEIYVHIGVAARISTFLFRFFPASGNYFSEIFVGED